MKNLTLRLCGLFVFLSFLIYPLKALAESNRPKLAILPSTDTSSYRLGAPLQNALGILFKQQNQFEVLVSKNELAGFSPQDIKSSMTIEGSELLSFVLLEQARISIFLFDSSHPAEYLYSSQVFSDSPTTKVDTPQIEKRFREAFTQVMAAHKQAQYQPLPGTKQQSTNLSSNKFSDPRIAEESRTLFRELSSQLESPFSIGAQIGMARFSSQGTTSSTVAFGLMGNYQLSPRVLLEAGANVSHYLMIQGGPRYVLPLNEKVVKFSVGLDIANVVTPVTQNLGYVSSSFSYDNPPIARGSLFFGPSLFFEIPLLGASLRGDLRFYTGSGTILMGTYGFVYNI